MSDSSQTSDRTGLATERPVATAETPRRVQEMVRRCDVEWIGDWSEVRLRFGRTLALGLTTPFQHPDWLTTWYETFGAAPGVTPVIAVVRASAGLPRADERDVVALLPLFRHRQRGLRIVEFAGAADYNAPIFGAAARDGRVDLALLWPALRRALAEIPGGCDLVRLRKMPVEVGGIVNPLAQLDAAQPCALNGHLVRTGDDFDAYRYSLERTVRKELERSWRVFTRHEGARFEKQTDPAEALEVFAVLERQQEARMRELGNAYSLNDAMSSAFHRDLIARGVASGSVVVTALRCGDEVVATLLGIRQGEGADGRYVMVRISNAGKAWSNCSPGRLIIERTMAALHAEGIRTFDFSVGDYAYKRRYGTVEWPLVDVTAAIGWRGWPVIARDALARWRQSRQRS
jgi:CelD/BcsL family acetyltransferase involved in cellulose biosynthesis